MGSDGHVDGCVWCEGALALRLVRRQIEVRVVKAKAGYLASARCSHGDGGIVDC
jgi:hypothetical protein